MTKITAVHFLNRDMTARNGIEKPWKVGETRTWKGPITLCWSGYHYTHGWAAALQGNLLYGPMACIVEVEELTGPRYRDEHKGVSRTRTLLEVYDVEREMRLFAADEAERALKAWEKRSGEKADPRSWAAIEAARLHADGKITDQQLDAAWAAAWWAAWATWAAWGAARDAARDAVGNAAWAASIAARDALDAAWDASARRFAARMKAATGWEDA